MGNLNLTLLDETKPDGSIETVSVLDNYERETRDSLKKWAGVEHDISSGRHHIPGGLTAERPAAPTLGTWFQNTQLAIIERWNGATWEAVTTLIPPGTRMVFDQDVAPVGWTRDVVINDKVIRIVSGARADGGAWVISGITATEPTHQHEVPSAGPASQFPNTVDDGAWPHGKSGNLRDTVRVGAGTGIWAGQNTYLSSPTSSVITVASDGTWRPVHRDMIVCQKD